MPTRKSTKGGKLSSLKNAVTPKKQTETIKTAKATKKTESTNTQKVDGDFEPGDIILYSKNGKPVQRCKALVVSGKDVASALVLEGGGQEGQVKSLEPGRTTHYRGEKILN
jgi:hypothetical protein